MHHKGKPTPTPVRVVCATRLSRKDFVEKSALGRSIKCYARVSGVDVQLFSENKRGLSEVYNEAIEASLTDDCILVFMHDDILIGDFFWADRIRAGFEQFDILGLAGNVRRLPYQVSWAFVDKRMTWDNKENLSGAVAHGNEGFPIDIFPYGPAGRECEILDGLFIAVHSKVLQKTSLRFDQRFSFHFYDLDFCRQARKKMLKLGTIALSVIHESAGDFLSHNWERAYEEYIDKWGS